MIKNTKILTFLWIIQMIVNQFSFASTDRLFRRLYYGFIYWRCDKWPWDVSWAKTYVFLFDNQSEICQRYV